MDPWLIALAVVVLFLVGVVFVPIRISLSARGRGEPSGAWAIASGVEIGPLVLSGVAARGVPATVAAQLFGRRVWQRQISELGTTKRDKKPKKKPESGTPLERAKQGYERLERWFDPLDLILHLLEEKRRIRIEKLEIDVGYSFEDVALTGKTLAALYVLSGVVPPPIVIRPAPSWEFVDKADLALSGSIRVWPGLVLVDTAWFVVRRAKLRKGRASKPSEAT